MARPVTTWPRPGSTPDEVLAELDVLRRALDGSGPAVAVPGAVRHPDPTLRVDERTALLVATSGTTGPPKAARLTAEALDAAVHGVEQALGGPAQWLLSIPPTHISGLSVLLRNLEAGWPTISLTPGHFDAEVFVAALRRLDGSAPRRCTTIVPTQLHRLLDSPRAVAAAREVLDVLVVGAARMDPRDRARALTAGLPVVDGYGCSETAGGCVYDGRAVPGMAVRLGAEGRIWLGGRQVALGHLDRPDLAGAFSVDEQGVPWFRTDDHGHLDEGHLRVDGRLDDLVNTGGLKVAPCVVEDALGRVALPGMGSWLVVGVEDPEWGERVALLATPPAGTPVAALPTLATIRAALRDELPGHALPTRLGWCDQLPLVGPGKPDRRAARRLLQAAR